MELPLASLTPLVIMAVYGVRYPRNLAGANVATSPAAVTVTVPLTSLLLPSFNKNVLGVMVALSISLLNLTKSTPLTGTSVASFTGLVDITVGGISTVSV